LFCTPNYFFIRPPEPTSAANDPLPASVILHIPQMPWMIAPADGGNGWSLAAGHGGRLRHLSLQAFAAVHLPEDQSAVANVPHDNELSAETGTAACSVAGGGRGE
jgi:hypothetical protein